MSIKIVFLVKDACEKIKISQPTWRTAIKKLEAEGFISDEGKYYLVRIWNNSSQLELRLIKFLLSFAPKLGGNIISVYSLLYKYWSSCKKTHEPCEITINQLKNIFVERRTKDITITYKLMLSLFQSEGLMDIREKEANSNGIVYRAYVINDVKIDIDYNEDLDEIAPDNIDDIIKKISSEEINNLKKLEVF